MTKNQPAPKWLWVTKVFGTFGYTSLLLQWGWLTLLVLPSLLDNQLVKELLLPAPTKQAQVVATADSSFSLLYAIIIAVVLVTALALTAYVLAKIPGQIARGGQKVITATTVASLPVLTGHKKLTAKKRLKLSLHVSKLVKLLFTLLPFGLLGLLAFVSVSLPTNVVWSVGGFLATGSLVWFSLEYLVAKLLAIDEQLLI